MRLVTMILFGLVSLTAADLEVVYLWPDGAPGSEGKTADEVTRLAPPNNGRVVSAVHKPSITVYLPEKPTGAGVVIAPGGGHRELWTDHEGHHIARWLANHGVAGFVLKYRLAREKESTYTIEGSALADTQQALAVVRKHASRWKVQADRIGVMGFSAGGELAALAAVRSSAETRPSFQALIYPAIPKDMPLSKETPPAFLVCGENDRLNISQGLPELYLAMKKAGMSAELHVYAQVGHGFGLRPTSKGPVQGWIQRFYEWLDVHGYLKNQPQ